MDVYIQYVRRDLKIGDINEGEELAWLGPVGLGTDRKLRPEFAPKPGDHIYLVSALDGKPPPALDAKIVVTDGQPLYPNRVAALGEARAQTYAAGPGSCWFPMLDATLLLENLKGERRRAMGPILGKPHNKHGVELSSTQRLQGARTIRRLVPESARDIRAWASCHLQRPVFISYASIDGKPSSAAVAKFLSTHRIPVWYDQWSISIRLDEIEWNNAEEQLLENIRRELLACAVVVHVKTQGYGASRWTQKEREWSDSDKVVEIESANLAALCEMLRDIRSLRDDTSTQ